MDCGPEATATAHPRNGDDLPTTEFPMLWHVGELDPGLKRRGSLEGSCLSVSRHPGAWREISDGLVSGRCWSMAGCGVRMLDAIALDDHHRASIIRWGISKGLCVPATMWRTSRYDDELDDVMTMTLLDRNDAICELDLDEEDPEYERRIRESVEEIHEHRSTPLLCESTHHDGEVLGDRSVLDMLMPLWVESETDLQGVWWRERLDPMAYSAPRGGLIPSRIDIGLFEPTTIEPYDDSDHEDGDDA